MPRFVTVTVIAALLLPAGADQARAAQRLIDVQQMATDTLRDVALAVVEHGRPVIYYNPGLMQQVGPNLEAFFFAHEYGHVRFGHTGAALASGEGDLSALRVRQELAADCYAAASLGETDPAAVAAAVQFFTRMGPLRFDAWHPSGSQRAAKILACLPVTENPTDSSAPPASADNLVGRQSAAAAAPGQLPS
jgi:hypothetical protein